MAQKILKVGSSAAVTIPKKSLEELGLKIGDSVRLEVDKIRKAVVVELFPKVDEEILDWTRKFIKRYRKALEALAKK